MVEDVERRHEEVPGRHPLASCRWARSSPCGWPSPAGAEGRRTEDGRGGRAGAHGGSSRRCWADRGGSAGIQALERAGGSGQRGRDGRRAVVASGRCSPVLAARRARVRALEPQRLGPGRGADPGWDPDRGIGAANVLFVDAASFVASGILVAIGVPAAASRAEPAAAPGGHSYLAELREGLRFIRAHTVLLSMILIATVGNFLDKPLVTVILPVYAKTFYGSPPALPGPRRLRRRRPDRLPAVRLAQAGISEWPPVPAMPMGTPPWPSSPSPGPQSSSTLPCVRARARRSYA